MGKKANKLKNTVKAVSAFKSGGSRSTAEDSVLDSFTADLNIPRKSSSSASSAAPPTADLDVDVSEVSPAAGAAAAAVPNKKKKKKNKNRNAAAAATSTVLTADESDSAAVLENQDSVAGMDRQTSVDAGAVEDEKQGTVAGDELEADQEIVVLEVLEEDEGALQDEQKNQAQETVTDQYKPQELEVAVTAPAAHDEAHNKPGDAVLPVGQVQMIEHAPVVHPEPYNKPDHMINEEQKKEHSPVVHEEEVLQHADLPVEVIHVAPIADVHPQHHESGQLKSFSAVTDRKEDVPIDDNNSNKVLSPAPLADSDVTSGDLVFDDHERTSLRDSAEASPRSSKRSTSKKSQEERSKT
eukprot:TRINITY_DN2643_c0_g1_i1.p2 TRINITY_DN2643_c0_g1~~TRINITY_DN2643_c0_g1_i1.p2  ORF type:complete len:378 (+),score=137.32 TRINITY_DN2643_c0_g1_i1:73-1134(+)